MRYKKGSKTTDIANFYNNNDMNKENLLKAADFVENIPQWAFNMGRYREGDDTKAECDSVGCALGHLTVLFPEHIRHRSSDGSINFECFADDVFDLSDKAWMWCFAAEWAHIDNTPEGCAKRLRYTAEEGEEAAEMAWLLDRHNFDSI